MSNIVMTTNCNKKCAYCFADHRSKIPMVFQQTNFRKAIDWLDSDNSGLVSRIGLLGGEPTMHPEFTNFLDYILSKKLNTIVFTNGTLGEDGIFDIIRVAANNKVSHANQLCFCVNVNEPKWTSIQNSKLQEQFLRILGHVSTLSFNIYERDFDPYFLLDYIDRYDMSMNIRLGLAMPLENRNKFLDPINYYYVAEKIVEFSNEASHRGITMDFDCGFVRCMFSDKQLKLLESSGTIKTLSFDCGPSIDIYPNLEITSCYPMANALRTKMSDFSSYKALYDFWKSKMSNMECLYNECATCNNLIDQTCDGGCKAHKIYG